MSQIYKMHSNSVFICNVSTISTVIKLEFVVTYLLFEKCNRTTSNSTDLLHNKIGIRLNILWKKKKTLCRVNADYVWQCMFLPMPKKSAG